MSISIVAGVGIIINVFSALLFFKEKNNDLDNILYFCKNKVALTT
jgi:Co/Zn/Cd efflux system component